MTLTYLRIYLTVKGSKKFVDIPYGFAYQEIYAIWDTDKKRVSLQFREEDTPIWLEPDDYVVVERDDYEN